MTKNNKKILKAITSISFLIAFIAIIIYWCFFQIQGIKGQEKIKSYTSPQGGYIVTIYRNNGGATTDFSILGRVKKIKTGKEKNIYWQYHCKDADVEWLKENIIKINGIVLNVDTEVYDYRRVDNLSN